MIKEWLVTKWRRARHRMAQRVVDWIIDKAKEKPYFHLEGYMNRWWLIGGSYCDQRHDRDLGWKRTKLDAFIGRFFSIRVHQILRSDLDRALHDHPWPSISILLQGQYIEVMPEDQKQHPALDTENYLTFTRKPGCFVRRKANDRHKLFIDDGETVWSLFIMGKKEKTWGFYTPRGFVRWTDYPLTAGQVAKFDKKRMGINE